MSSAAGQHPGQVTSTEPSPISPPFQAILEALYAELDHLPLPTTWTSGSTVVQGCLPLLIEEVPAAALIARLGQSKYETLRSLYRQSILLNLWYTLALQEVLTAITEAAIPVMVLKGADLATTFYSRPELRHFGDVDLMVQSQHLQAVIALLERFGYSYHQEYRFEAISRRRAAFVYVKEVACGYLVFEIHTAPHSNEMGVSFSPHEIWRRARAITVAGVQVKGMGLEDLLLYLCWHYRSHAFNRLIWLYDIAAVLLRCADRIDWQLVHTLARQRGLVATVSYCMRWCQLLFGIVLPASAFSAQLRVPDLTSHLITRMVSDDCSAILAHTAYRPRKLLQRFMVDNVRALCLVMLHIIVPSPTHLGRLYAEHSRLPVQLVWLYYPLHPLIVLGTYIREHWRGKRSHRI